MNISKSIIITLVGLVALLVGVSFVYDNLNDGRYTSGHGYIKVSGCQADGEGYLCGGDFMQYGGMVTVPRAELHTDRAYQGGQRIDDIYATYTRRDAKGDPIEAALKTGNERRSFKYNLGHIGLIVIGIVLVGIPPVRSLYSRSIRKRNGTMNT